MKERNLFAFCFTAFFICIILLYVFVTQVGYTHVNIGDIDRSFVGKAVNITGEVSDLTKKGNLFFDIEDKTGSIKVVLWEDTAEVLEMNGVNVYEIEEGDRINIIGNVQIYKGELEVMPLQNRFRILE